MIIRISAVLALLFLANFSSLAHDSDRIDQLEREVQETKKRLSKLESMFREKKEQGEITGTGEGWRSLANWRKLTTGMNRSAVKKILGEPKRIDGGDVANWHYENGGTVDFLHGKVRMWSEPR